MLGRFRLSISLPTLVGGFAGNVEILHILAGCKFIFFRQQRAGGDLNLKWRNDAAPGLVPEISTVIPGGNLTTFCFFCSLRTPPSSRLDVFPRYQREALFSRVLHSQACGVIQSNSQPKLQLQSEPGDFSRFRVQKCRLFSRLRMQGVNVKSS